jgi:hypothetical protein
MRLRSGGVRGRDRRQRIRDETKEYGVCVVRVRGMKSVDIGRESER